MAGGFSRLGIGLTAVVIFFLLALAVELFCVFWCRRRRFSRETSTATPSISMSDRNNLYPSSTVTPPASKEHLYLLCSKQQSSSVEPSGAVPTRYPVTELADISRKLNGAAAEADATTWWMGMYGPSILLHTTKEAEKKKEESSSSSAATDDLERGVALRETTTTLFSTPCASPPFYTPLSSPLAERKSSAGNPATVLEKTAWSAEQQL